MSNESIRAARPEVLPLLTRIDTHRWGNLCELVGTQEQLVAAGIVSADWLADLGKSGRRTRRDEWANRVMIIRRARGRFEVTIWSHAADDFNLDWYRERHRADFDDVVAEALVRMRLPRKQRPRGKEAQP